jgi:beta-glucosidase
MNKYQELCSQLSLDEKILLITGADFWSTAAIPHIGLEKIVLSDGPSGVRGPLWDERDPSLSFPSASSVSASFSHEGVRLIGQLSAFEARRKGVDVVLGPTINLHRSPLGGRHFECYSEDPIYSGLLAAEYINALQDQGVAGTLKHFVANDSENDRMSMSSEVDDATLWDVYLKPFEIAVREANPWLVMSSYNRINGVHGSDNKLLDHPLKEDWGWDGVVVSDWGAVNFTVESAIASTDLEMPGPIGQWGAKLKIAIQTGQVPEAFIDKKVVRIIRLADRVGRLGTPAKLHRTFSNQETQFHIRELAADGTVLVKNINTLPLNSGVKIALFGGHAQFGREQGGGSATVVPAEVIYPLEGLRNNAPTGTTIDYYYAVDSSVRLNLFNRDNSKLPESNEPGVHLQILDASGKILVDETRLSSQIICMDQEIATKAERAIIRTDIYVDSDGEYYLGMATVGNVQFGVNGKVIKMKIGLETNDPAEYILNPPEGKSKFKLKAGIPNPATFIYEKGGSSTSLPAFSFIAGIAPVCKPVSEVLREAATVAQKNDVSIVFTGTNSNIESEGYDRKNMTLPDGHNNLIHQVARNSKKTVVVVNAGSPIEMPWFDEVDAVLISWFPGQQMGNAIADIIYGVREAGGRMPTTWPIAMSDCPVLNTNPTDGKLFYSEGSYIGYRGYIKNGIIPRLPFGYGLSYTEFSAIFLSTTKKFATIQVENLGDREGFYVAQIYVQSISSKLEDRKFAGFKKVKIQPGETLIFEVAISQDASISEGAWKIALANHAFEEGQSIVSDN